MHIPVLLNKQEVAAKFQGTQGLILLMLLSYLTLHLLEEGIFGFPAWAQVRWGIPNYTVLRWLVHNVYFMAVLLLGFALYRRYPGVRALGLGILAWGALNTLNHLIFSLIYREYVPGLVTGLWFAWVAWAGFRQAWQEQRITRKEAMLTLLMAVSYWIVPMMAFVAVDIITG